MDKFELKKEQSVLMVIDIQERLVPVMERRDQVIRNAQILISAAQRLDIPVIVTEQYPKGLGRTVKELSDMLGDFQAFEKLSFSAYIPEVAAQLARLGRKKVIVCGMETHVCVFQTVRELLQAGYQAFVVKDAVCSRTQDNHQNGLDLMEGMGAVITNTETVLFDLLKTAGTPEFKELSRLIK
ncbi:nicotinamidase-related amidase [Caldicoprobacter guelmensis]|uniref:hydrolase n=1 Tax=Caldicoprobacter guelmensis TaxID=1170224 RepID=UPI00195A2FEE|nr:hydrolase [Caldicoprobacter guelmensis]MBM7581184.1 nicotinamidase-related amidase [Caldicoprobacter guelmensis]